jgi:predicted transcriptional regulator
MLDIRPKVFGSQLRSRVLVLVATLGETYPAEIARLLKAPRFSVQRIIDDLEGERLVATRLWGNERRVTLQPGSLGAKELRAYLLRLADGYPEFGKIADSLRRRPRRRGKSLLKQGR